MKHSNAPITTNNYLLLIHHKLCSKYSNNLNIKHNIIVINNILSNNKCHIVALFKDFLLYDEYVEFLKRYYKNYEIGLRLDKIFKFYKKASFIFPNYSPLVESKYLFCNILKKQMIINRISKKKKGIRKSNKENKIEVNKKEKDFFSNTIYTEILNESESFMSLLFGEENKNKNKEKKIDDKVENEKEIEDFKKIIDTIQKTEIKKKKNLDLLFKSNEKNKRINYKKPDISDIQVSASTRFNKKKKKVLYPNNNNYSSSFFIKSTRNSTVSATNSVINTIQNQKYFLDNYNKNKIKNNLDSVNKDTIYKKVFLNNISNNASKENIQNNKKNSLEKKQDKIVYHRKVKSTLIGNYLNKLDLPSNLSVINSLKIANEAFADSQKKNIIKVSFYRRVKNNKSMNNINELKNSMTKIINLPKQIYASNKNIKNNKTQKFKTPKGKDKENVKIKLTKGNNNSTKNIEIPIISKKPSYYLIKKRKSPVYIRNHISTMSFNNSNGEVNNNTMITNNYLNSYKKPESGCKSIYINPSMTGPYSKPKGLYKDKKYNGISAKKLFNNSGYCLSSEKVNQK